LEGKDEDDPDGRKRDDIDGVWPSSLQNERIEILPWAPVPSPLVKGVPEAFLKFELTYCSWKPAGQSVDSVESVALVPVGWFTWSSP
jgi:hypothetical protein